MKSEYPSSTRPVTGHRPDSPLRVLQITDCHLYANPGRCLAGLNTLGTFDAVLDLVKTGYGATDLILATGDLVHDASPTGYERMRERFENTDLPVYCLPGNHDIPEVMSRSLNRGRVTTPEAVRRGDWLIILLDSTVPGRAGGHLGTGQLEMLERNLRQNPGRHVLISLHHHPLPIGSAWMDRMALDNAASFFQVVDRFPQVRTILFGHIHQEFETRRSRVRILGAPSTCVQFAPGQDQFNLDLAPPGLRWLELKRDGSVKTGIERLEEMPLELDMGLAGYS